MVILAGVHQAWLLYDNVASKLAKAVFSRLSSGENLGGFRLLRGYDQMLKATEKLQQQRRPSEPKEDPLTGAMDISETTQGETAPSPVRQTYVRTGKIKHLIFAIHG